MERIRLREKVFHDEQHFTARGSRLLSSKKTRAHPSPPRTILTPARRPLAMPIGASIENDCH